MFKTFKIIGCRFSTERKYYDWDKSQTYFYYDLIEEKELGIFKFKNLDAAKAFLLANYPEYYFGAGIVQTDKESGNDFWCNAVPQYYEMEYNTSDRNIILKDIIEKTLRED